MFADPTALVMTIRAEHELRMRKARGISEAEAAVRDGRCRTKRPSLRRLVGDVLVFIGHRLQGRTPLPTAGALGRIAS